MGLNNLLRNRIVCVSLSQAMKSKLLKRRMNKLAEKEEPELEKNRGATMKPPSKGLQSKNAH